MWSVWKIKWNSTDIFEEEEEVQNKRQFRVLKENPKFQWTKRNLWFLTTHFRHNISFVKEKIYLYIYIKFSMMWSKRMVQADINCLDMVYFNAFVYFFFLFFLFDCTHSFSHILGDSFWILHIVSSGVYQSECMKVYFNCQFIFNSNNNTKTKNVFYFRSNSFGSKNFICSTREKYIIDTFHERITRCVCASLFVWLLCMNVRVSELCVCTIISEGRNENFQIYIL